jgi:hypothetical protein
MRVWGEGRFQAVVRTARPELEMGFVGSEAPRKTEESRRLFDDGKRRRGLEVDSQIRACVMTQLVLTERNRRERAQRSGGELWGGGWGGSLVSEPRQPERVGRWRAELRPLGSTAES